MLIGTSKNLQKQSSLNIHINETILENVDTHKLMGVYINKNLKWNPHISYVYKNDATNISPKAPIFLSYV